MSLMRGCGGALLVIAMSSVVGSGGCSQPESTWDRPEPCAITVCLNGAGGRNHPGNQVVDELCGSLPGVVKDCSRDGECWPSYSSQSVESARAGVLDAWGQLDEAERQTCPVSVLGYSLGGVGAVSVARTLGDDDIEVDRLVLLDPFSPTGPDPLDVPESVTRAWVYRHSVAPESDCSNERRPIGPYLGFRPRCVTPGECRDYDYSLDPDLADEVGHCKVPEVASQPALDNLLTGEDSAYENLPEPVAVEAY